MTPSLKAKIVKAYRDRFTYANFTWNGEVHDGLTFAKAQFKTLQKFLITACQSSYEAGQRSVVEAIVKMIPDTDERADIIYGFEGALEAARNPLNKKP